MPDLKRSDKPRRIREKMAGFRRFLGGFLVGKGAGKGIVKKVRFAPLRGAGRFDTTAS